MLAVGRGILFPATIPAGPRLVWGGAAALAAVAGVWLGPRLRGPLTIVLVGIVVLGVALGVG